MVRYIIALIAGAAVPVFVYERVGWWLNSSQGVHLQSALLFAVGAVVTFPPRRERPPFTWWFPAAFATLAAVVASSALLFWIGPGTIFPIVLAFVVIACTLATFAGALLAAAPALWQRRTEFVLRWKPMLAGAVTFLIVESVIAVTYGALFGPRARAMEWFASSGASAVLLWLAFCGVAAVFSRVRQPSSFRDDMLDALFMAAGGGAPMLIRLIAVLHEHADVVPAAFVLGLMPLLVASLLGAVLGRTIRDRDRTA